MARSLLGHRTPVMFLFGCLCMLTVSLLFVQCSSGTKEYTRGIGIYPGNPDEDYSPTMVIDDKTPRNLALHRPAYYSSCYDNNLTAQLITDGIVSKEKPYHYAVTTSTKGALPRNERAYILDNHSQTAVSLDSVRTGWYQIELMGDAVFPAIDSVTVQGSRRGDPTKSDAWTVTVSGSDDGEQWNQLGTVRGTENAQAPRSDQGGFQFGFGGGGLFNKTIKLSKPARHRFYRVALESRNTTTWNMSEIMFFGAGEQVRFGEPAPFTSAWMSAGVGEQWVYVDLGAYCTFNRLSFHWIQRAATGTVQVSPDAVAWTDAQSLPGIDDIEYNLQLDQPQGGRYVRILMTRPASPDAYILSELAVYGTGGPVPVAHPAPVVASDGRLDLAGGGWRLQRDSLVPDNGTVLSQTGFNDSTWVIATVPATVLASYVNIGAIPDPNDRDNQLMISDSFFNSDFWYRTEFTTPTTYKGRRIFLNFDGVNWKADVFLNGRNLGRIEGAFTRGQFDITDILNPDVANALAVRIIKNASPGSTKEKTYQDNNKNGGELGLDNPTFHASVGWDWIPTIRGRNTGLWNDVYLTVSGPVSLADPFVTTDLPLPDTTSVDVTVAVTVKNREAQPVSGKLKGSFGNTRFELPVALGASESKLVTLNPASNPGLKIKNPNLWWPNGYGAQALYPVKLSFVTDDGKTSDVTEFETGVREMTYTEDNNTLKIFINGRRFIARGGNWGFPESMLRYRAREYDAAVRYHADMHFTMIRNWVGQTGDEEFYEACDKYGIMVWQDFWMANPADGPNPGDSGMFMRNAGDTVLRIRNHPCMALYVGRNEGNPPPEIDTGLRDLIAKSHPGLHYISNSAMGVVSGGGPYRAMTSKEYFQQRATPKLHSEMGMPTVVTYESLERMMPGTDIWPQGNLWGLHDFTLNGAQNGQSFNNRIETNFWPTSEPDEFTEMAQWVNYEGYRAMFEAQSKNRMGLLLWMSHPSWPSLVWQTYDYYLEPTAAYFGSKKGAEPLHIQWNPLTETVEVVNYSAGSVTELTAAAELFNLDGSVAWKKESTLSSEEDKTVTCFSMEYPDSLSEVHFIRLKLTKDSKTLSDNFYWRSKVEGSYKDIVTLENVTVETKTSVKHRGQQWLLSTTLTNPSSLPVLMIRLKVVRSTTGDRILPVIYSDNYISLMPKESRTITMELADADTRGEKPRVDIEGFNIEKPEKITPPK
jgi:hypothetical protein